jgi:hypothetical protein
MNLDLDWPRILTDLDSYGCSAVRNVLSADECAALAASYDAEDLFRSRVVMARHGFGRGEYKYFSYPLPKPVAALRETLYPKLAPLANRWNEAMGIDLRFPAKHAAFLEMCHRAGQVQPTPLMLQYGAGDYNLRHRPVHGTRGSYRVNLRHGVSRVRAGRRHTLGIIFHDAL